MKHPILLITFLMLFATSVFAQIPQTMSYQGVLTDANGAAVADGQVNLTFKLYDAATDGTMLWEETQQVQVANGIFNVILGTSNPLTLPFDKPYWLGMTIGTDAELQPRTALTSSPYSLNSQNAGNTGDGHSLDAVDGDPVDAVFVDGEGNVGIGTMSPQSKLHVAGLLSVEAEGDNSVILFETASDKKATIGVQDDGDAGFFIYMNDQYRLNVNQNGNVGIGTQTPAEKFEVVGNVRANGTIETTSGGFKFPDGTVQTTAANGATGDGHSLDAADGDPVDAVFVDNDGKVGIGTTTPEAALHINILASSQLRLERPAGDLDKNKWSFSIGSDIFESIPTRSLLINPVSFEGDFAVRDVDGDVTFYADNSKNNLIVPNGSVGIGTTSPDVPLHIATGSDISGTGGGRLLLGSATGTGLRMDGNEIQAFTSGTSAGATLFLQNEGDGNVNLGGGALYVKSDGNVGIGTTAPSAKLSVITTKTNQTAVFGKSSDSFGGDFRGAENNGISKAAVKIISGTQIMFLDGNEIDALTSGLFLNHNSDKKVILATGGGYVGIGISNPLAKLHIKQPGNSPFDGIRLEHPNSDYWETYLPVAGSGSTTHYSFARNGDLMAYIAGGNGSYTQISDRKLKKNIRKLEPVLDRVLQLSPSRYQFKNSPASAPASIGFIAQEVEPLFPEFVSESDGTKALAYANFGVIAIKAIQEQQELIKALQQRIEDLEARLN